MMSDNGRRLARLEYALGDALRDLDDLRRQLGAVKQALGQARGSGGPGSAVDLLVALTPSGGIPYAVYTPESSPDPWTLVPGSATCAIGRLLSDGSFEDSGNADTVYNDYTSSSSTDVAGDTVVPVGRDASGRYRLLGEPC